MNYLMNDQGDLIKFSAHKTPEFKELKNRDWILWGYSTEDREWNNKQPQYYEWLYNSSSKHRAIVNRKTLFIQGKGLKAETRGLNFSEEIALKGFAFKYENSDFIRKCALNLVKIGGLSYEVIPDKAGKKITAHYINFGFLRRSKLEYENGRLLPGIWYYTCDWSTRKPEENPDFTEFNEWDWESPMDKNKRYIVVDFDDEINPYPVPEYTAAIPYIAADYEISNFVYNNTKNGFSAGWLVNFYNGEPNDEEKSKIANYWKSRLHGSDNSGEPVLAFNDIGVDGVNITPLNPNGQDDRFINLNKQIREEIFSGHTVDPVVVGLEGNNGFNNNADEKRTAIEDFQVYYVRGKQMKIEQHLNAIAHYNEIKGNIYIQRLDPIQAQFSSAEIMQIATTDELRKMNGFEQSTTEANPVADALATISPLVATKVLESMSLEEIRGIVGLNTPKEGVDKGTTESTIEMSKQDKIIYELSKCGVWDDDLEFLGGKQVSFNSIEEAENYNFLNAQQLVLLGLIFDNPGLDIAALAELMKRPVSEVQELYNGLKDEGMLNDDGTPTAEAESEAGGEVFVVYKYVKRMEASGPSIKDTTRPFCKNLVTLSEVKSWTFEDIKRMNNDQGLDVFRSGGGYWNDNGNIKPHCRHSWRMSIVRRRNG